MAKEVTTLFIRDNAVSLLVVEGKRIKKWASLMLEPGLVDQGLVLDEEQVADKVKELFKLAEAKTTKVIAGLSGHNSLYRLITLPEMPEAMVAEAVRHEARRVIPVPLDEVYLSYQMLPVHEGERRIFLAAHPCNMANALNRTLRRAGVEPYIMDLAPLALCRNLDEPRGIIVNARLDHLDIVVMVDRLPEVIRRLTLPSEAESLSEKLPTITEEIDRTVAFYNSSHQEKPIDSTVPVFVCGDLVEVMDSWQSLIYPVSPLPSPLESPEGFNPNEFLVNIGLALKELLPTKGEANFSLVNFNALPEVSQPKALRGVPILVPLGIVIGIGLVIFMVFQVQNSIEKNDVLRSELAPIESSIDEQRREILTLQDGIKQIEAQIKPVEATTNIFTTKFTSLGEGREKVDGDLAEIVSLVPEHVDLINVIHSGDTITINGIASDEDDIFEYAKDLRSSDRHFTVIILSITATEGEGEEIRELNFGLLLR